MPDFVDSVMKGTLTELANICPSFQAKLTPFITNDETLIYGRSSRTKFLMRLVAVLAKETLSFVQKGDVTKQKYKDGEQVLKKRIEKVRSCEEELANKISEFEDVFREVKHYRKN